MKWLNKTLFSKKFWLGTRTYDAKVTDLSVTVVIPAWNEEKFIAKTIESVLAQSYVTDIIVVNDASTDRTAWVARGYPSVRVLTTPVNQGSKSQALNYAIPFVKTDIFICVDADTELEADAVEKMVSAFADEEVMVASGFVLSNTANTIWQMGRYAEYVLGQTLIKDAQANASCVLVASGCFFGVRTEFLKKHRFSHRTMAEDMDMTWVAVEHGHEVAFVKGAGCTVSDPDSFKIYYKQVSRWYRGFFQAMRVRKMNLFGSLRLAVPAYGYMLWNIFSFPALVYATFMMPGILFSLIFGLWVFYSFIMLWANWKLYEPVYMAPVQAAAMFFISIVNWCIYMESLIKELILGKKLTSWTKGH